MVIHINQRGGHKMRENQNYFRNTTEADGKPDIINIKQTNKSHVPNGKEGVFFFLH